VTDSSPADPTVWENVRHRLAQMQAARTRNVDPAALAEKLARRAKTLRSRTAGPEPIGPRWDMLAFTSGRERYGIAVDEIIEVQPLDQFSLVPRAPAFILGVVHFRGAIVSLLDLGRLLNVPPSGLADLHVHIVVEAAGPANRRRCQSGRGDLQRLGRPDQAGRGITGKDLAGMDRGSPR
jgi:purine-binding chemotaxis protein CheW